MEQLSILVPSINFENKDLTRQTNETTNNFENNFMKGKYRFDQLRLNLLQ